MAENKASLNDVGLAWFFPAISKPVPWSGEVRTLERPAVKLTPLPKLKALNGANP